MSVLNLLGSYAGSQRERADEGAGFACGAALAAAVAVDPTRYVVLKVCAAFVAAPFVVDRHANGVRPVVA